MTDVPGILRDVKEQRLHVQTEFSVARVGAYPF